MKKFILVWALLLSACASHHPVKVVVTPIPESHKSVIEPQPIVTPSSIPAPAPIEVQAPIRSNHPPKKNEHNVEED